MSETGKLISQAIAPEETRGDVYLYWCPGCEEHHQIIVGPDMWGFDGDQHNPTVDGSVLVRGGRNATVCHSFIRAGHIQYLADSTHELAGQTVPMRPFN